jgi:ribosomal protein L37AE/L43A
MNQQSTAIWECHHCHTDLREAGVLEQERVNQHWILWQLDCTWANVRSDTECAGVAWWLECAACGEPLDARQQEVIWDNICAAAVPKQ